MKKIYDLNGEYLLTDKPYVDQTIDNITEYLAGADYIKATVPGDINNDLVQAGLKPDPYYEYNTDKFRDVTEKDWFYVKNFQYKKTDSAFTNLVFEGIDTFADIYLNGKLLGSQDNMHRKYVYDIKDCVLDGCNQLIVRMKSLQKIVAKNDLSKYRRTGFCKDRILVRKIQCHFQWDWAPYFLGLGIFRNVYIETKDFASIDSVQIKTENDGKIRAFLKIRRNDANPGTVLGPLNEQAPNELARPQVDITLIVSDGETQTQATIHTKCCTDFINLKINNPKLWWCHGYGDQNLYNYQVIISYNGEVLDIAEGKFAFRTVEIVEDQLATNHMGMQVRLNGVPVMIKGANWVPIDCMTGTIPDSKYIKQINNALDANFTAFRVWGGGLYENDIFYDYCDQKGIMIFHDFMFACSDIPEDNVELMQNFIVEAEQQVVRLRNHPSIIMWFGNNEHCLSRHPNPYNGKFTLKYLIRGIVGDLDGTRPYKFASPDTYKDYTNEVLSCDHHGNFFNDPLLKTYDAFRHTCQDFPYLFETEMAIQGSGELRTVKKYIPDEYLWPLNDLWKFHFSYNPWNHEDVSFYQTMERKIEDMFGSPSISVEDYTKKSQIVQYIYTKEMIEASKAKLGQCNAMMFWMYSDIWPTGTWAISDFYNQPKSGAYACRKTFRPKAISIVPSKSGCKVCVSNETRQGIQGSVEYGVMKYDGTKLWTKEVNYDCGSYKTIIIDQITQLDDDCLAYAIMDNDIDSFADYIPINYKQYKCNSQLTYSVIDSKKVDNYYVSKISIKCTEFAKIIYINVNQDIEYMSDNFFDMLPNTTRVIEVKTLNPIEKLDVFHMSQTWH